jgi:hypothetical protein
MNSSQPGRTPSGKTHKDAAAPARVRHVDSQQDGGDENATRLPRADAGGRGARGPSKGGEWFILGPTWVAQPRNCIQMSSGAGWTTRPSSST